jgi:glycosyltransferase involved in cell wall biosynthesis
MLIKTFKQGKLMNSTDMKTMKKKINLVFMGGFTYPRGMAGTKRIQNAINALKQYPDISIRVILQRQSSKDNILSGVYEGTLYETVMGDLLRSRMFTTLPSLYYKTVATLKRVYSPDHKNVIYFYGPLFIDSVAPLGFAKKLGYKIVFDVIEDYSLTKEESLTFYHRVKSHLTNLFSSKIKDLSAGIIVISSHLEKKCRMLTQDKVPIHYMPVSVNMDCFPPKPERKKSIVSMFYAGSFGKKDGLPILLDAFDKLAARYGNVHLILTGRGDNEEIMKLLARIEVSPNIDRIFYKGYLDDREYYSLLNDVEIPCMTRIDHAYANAGFPFKLGEFLATGKPVIASRVSDVERFLVSGHSAMLVQPNSSLEICEAVEFLINNPELALAIGARGREVAESFFDYRQQGKALLSFLEKV